MLNGAYAGIAFGNDCAASSVHHIFGNALNNRLSLQVGALESVAGVLWGGIECGGGYYARVQTFARHRERIFQRMLFGHVFLS